MHRGEPARAPLPHYSPRCSQAAGGKGSPGRRPPPLAPGHINPYESPSCPYPAASSPQGEGCGDFGALHRHLPSPPPSARVNQRFPPSPEPRYNTRTCYTARSGAALPGRAGLPGSPRAEQPGNKPRIPLARRNLSDRGLPRPDNVPLQRHDFASHAGHGATARPTSSPASQPPASPLAAPAAPLLAAGSLRRGPAPGRSEGGRRPRVGG